jgi:hypothetical protein
MKKWKEWNMSFHGHVMTEITATKSVMMVLFMEWPFCIFECCISGDKYASFFLILVLASHLPT